MAASATDYFTKVGNPGTATTLDAPGHTIGGTSITVISTSNWPTGTGVVFAMDATTIVDGTETRTVGTYTEWEGVVASATSITGMVLRYGTDQNYTAGTSSRVYIPVAGSQNDRMVDGLISAGLTQTGGMDAIAPASIVTTGNGTIGGNAAVTGTTTLTGALTVKSYDGYITPSYTPVYVSASSIKVTGSDVTAQFPVGTKVKFTQTSAKYFYVTSSSFSTDTTINLTGGSDYTVANAAISGFAYSYDETPQGFPGYFNYTPSPSNFTIGTGGSAGLVGAFAMNGKTVHFRALGTLGTSGQSVGSSPTFTLPVTASTNASNMKRIGVAYINDSSAGTYEATTTINSTTTAGAMVVNTTFTYSASQAPSSTIPMSWAAGDQLGLLGTYEAA